MFKPCETSGFGCGLLVVGVLSGAILGASLIASGASAGECPADQKKPNAREAVDVGHDGVTDTVIAMIDVDKEQGIKDRAFRMRRLNIEPGATVPWHSHAERPAIIYIIEGTVEEYASNCAVPIVHKAGEVVAETKDVSHWWKNTGNEPVVLISADLLKDPNDKNM
jgi:quercetin dioxygenase-like cupin family protein